MTTTNHQIAKPAQLKQPRRWSSLIYFGLIISLTLVFLKLSHWQWQRALAKDTLQKQGAVFAQQAQQQTFSLTKLKQHYKILDTAIADAPMRVSGYFLPSWRILHDNRLYQSKAGYHILFPFMVLPEKEVILVNYGWHALVNQRRDQFPDIQIPTTQPITLNGTLQIALPTFTLSNSKPIAIDPNKIMPQQATITLNPPNHTLLAQNLVATTLSDKLNFNVLPFMLRLTSNEINDPISPLNREWTAQSDIGLSADQHRGYALQWLLIATVFFFWALRSYLIQHKPS